MCSAKSAYLLVDIHILHAFEMIGFVAELARSACRPMNVEVPAAYKCDTPRSLIASPPQTCTRLNLRLFLTRARESKLVSSEPGAAVRPLLKDHQLCLAFGLIPRELDSFLGVLMNSLRGDAVALTEAKPHVVVSHWAETEGGLTWDPFQTIGARSIRKHPKDEKNSPHNEVSVPQPIALLAQQ